MTFFSEINEKSQFIQSHSNAALNREIAYQVSSQLSSGKDITSLAPGTVKYLIFDLNYLMFRHLAWHHAPLFSELCIDYLNSEFKLPNKLATNVVESCLDAFSPYFKPEDDWSLEDFDKEFLFDLFVASATAKNEAELRSDIGFGSNVIQLFHSAAKLVAKKPSYSYSFEPKVTQSILTIMDEIGSEADSIPWIMDIYKLRLLLSPKLNQSGNFRLTREQLHKIFSLLTMIGWQGIKHSQLEKSTQKQNLAENDDISLSKAILSLPQALRILSQHQLIYCHRIRGEDYYHLSTSGLELCSDYLARHELSSIHDSDKLCRLPAKVQAKVLDTNLARSESLELSQFLKIASRLAPESVEIMVARFAGAEHSKQLLELLQKLLHNSQNAWARVKMSHALINLRDFHNDEVKGILSQLAERDSSPMVRKSARSLQAKLLRPVEQVSK